MLTFFIGHSKGCHLEVQYFLRQPLNPCEHSAQGEYFEMDENEVGQTACQEENIQFAHKFNRIKYFYKDSGYGWKFLGAPNSGQLICIFAFYIKIHRMAVQKILYCIWYKRLPSTEENKLIYYKIETLRFGLRPRYACHYC